MNYEERQALTRRKIGVNISVSLPLWEIVDRYADAYTQGNISRALEEILRAGLKALAAENIRQTQKST